jgi:hypothetical protein
MMHVHKTMIWNLLKKTTKQLLKAKASKDDKQAPSNLEYKSGKTTKQSRNESFKRH